MSPGKNELVFKQRLQEIGFIGFKKPTVFRSQTIDHKQEQKLCGLKPSKPSQLNKLSPEARIRFPTQIYFSKWPKGQH